MIRDMQKKAYCDECRFSRPINPMGEMCMGHGSYCVSHPSMSTQETYAGCRSHTHYASCEQKNAANDCQEFSQRSLVSKLVLFWR